MSEQVPLPNEKKDRVPLFGTWRSAYVTVVIVFIFDVALFYIFQRYFS